MTTTDLIILAAAAFGVVLILKKGGALVPLPAGPYVTPAGATEIFDIGGGAFSNAWRYFSDGTAIDPSGAYYSGGELVWSPK